MRRNIGRATFSLLGIFMLVACGSGTNTLDGSLADVVDLGYERAELAAAEGSLVLKFLRPRGTGEDVVLKLSVNTAGLTAQAVIDIDLTEQVAELGPRGAVTRHVFEDPNETLPPIRRGRLVLQEVAGTTDRVKGEFSATFTQGHEFGAGRTVYGEFEAEVIR
ncbi:MAG: hypothetical protein WBV82_16705 [Myxococcaceae bacterium]